MISLTKIDPSEYLEQSPPNEGMVMRFRYRPDKARFDLVFDFAAEAISEAFAQWPRLPDPPPPIDMRWLRFCNVTKFQCTQGTPEGVDSWGEYERKIRSPGHLILDAVIERCSSGFRCDIWLDTFGKHSFFFDSALAARRLVYAKKRQSNWDYFDTETHEPVDFFNPFPEIDDD